MTTSPHVTGASPHALVPQVPAHSGAFRLIGCTLWDGTGRGLIEDGELVVSEGRVAYAGPRRDGFQEENDPTIDLDGAFVLPGFIDTHVHLRLDLEAPPEQVQARFPSEAHFHTAATSRATLESGITTARDLGGLDAGYRHAIRAGLIDGPRMHIAVRVISPTGGHVDMRRPNGTRTAHMGEGTSQIVDTDDEMRKAVRELLLAEADVIKLCTTGGVSSPSDTPHDLGVPEHQVRIAVEETGRRAGQPIAAHAQGAEGILTAVRGGAASIEHGYEITPEAVALMKARGTFLVPTLTSALRLPDPAKVPAFLYAKKVRWSQIAREHIAAAFAAGVKVALGTDSGVSPHGRGLTELGHMVDLGMAPEDALLAGTRNAAELLRIQDDLGTLEAGKLADFVITRAHPLRDIHALADPRSITVVVQGGHVKKDLTRSWPEDPVPTPSSARLLPA